MIDIYINDPLHHHLEDKKPVYIIDGIHHDHHEAILIPKTPDFIVPPLNTHINFLKYTQAYSDEDHLDLHIRYSSGGYDIDPPHTYDWRFIYPFDNTIRRERKKYITPPDNQYLCGSCWAVSSATVIGDAFAAAGLVNWRPDISSTWALTCYPQGQCKGGNPALLLQDIASGSGIPSKHCLDYSFCATNSQCNGEATQHFYTENLSSLVPRECGCYYGGDQNFHYNYTINRDVKTLAIDHGSTTPDNIRSAVKKHILVHGPALTGYIIFKNFTSGYFTKLNGGVYLERCNYVPGSPLIFNDNEASSSSYKGQHAVAIIGWGVAKNILYDNDKRGDVPYWYCRNSWGPNWGADDGYFKIAMYPFNKIAQFGKIVNIRDSQGYDHTCGGIITFTVSKPPERTTFKTLIQNRPPRLLHDSAYYTSLEAQYKPTGEPQPPPNNNNVRPLSSYYKIEDLVLYLFLPAFVIFMIIMVFKIFRQRTF